MSGHVVGETDAKTGDIALNLTLLYEMSNSQEEFIELFSTILTHEQIHRELDGILKRNKIKAAERRTKYYFGEEVVVRKLCGQQFNDREKHEYERISKNNYKRRRNGGKVVRSKRNNVRLRHGNKRRKVRQA